MNDQLDTQASSHTSTIDTEASATLAPPPVVTTAKAQTRWSVRAGLTGLLLLNLGTVAGGAWLWHHSDLQQREQAGLLRDLQSLEQKQVDNRKLHDSQQQQLLNFKTQTIAALTDTKEKLRNLERIDTSYWRLSESEFLLNQAQQRLFIAHDADTAELLLASADNTLSSLRDPALLPVRQAIAQDRAALRKVPQIDREGVYLRLEALSSQVGALTADNRFLQSADSEIGEADGSLQGFLEQLWQRLTAIIRVRHHDQPVEPLLPPEQELYFKQNLQLALVQAQLGVLQSQQQTYVGNLERSFAWVNQYCQTSDPVVASWLEEAQQLMRLNIAPELPDISGSVKQVQQLIEQRADDIQRTLLMEDDSFGGSDDSVQE